MKKFLKIKTTERTPNEIYVDISDETCKKYGFLHGDVMLCTDKLEATVKGVALGKMWYEKDHNAVRGKSCCWGGEETNLLKAGFTLIRRAH
ncbi:MAG: hypothetical protein NTV03_01135 [Candidatus Nomurabacteria bacterium]|nr:hypothetical protein [Candidatus Nomurabacteria bacterium]